MTLLTNSQALSSSPPTNQAQRLIQLRKAKGLTTEELAKQMTQAGAKVSRGAISNWERGINGIVSSKLPILAKILGCSESYLLTGENNLSALQHLMPTDNLTPVTIPLATQKNPNSIQIQPNQPTQSTILSSAIMSPMPLFQHLPR